MKYISGMPCHKYIIRKLKSEANILEFERAYIDTMTKFGFSDDDISLSLTTMEHHIPPGSPISGRHFDIIGSVNLGDIVNSVRFDPEIHLYKNCKSYYRKVDGHYRCCELCEFSDRYKNKHLGLEQKAIRYMLASNKNLSYCIKQGIDVNCFHGVYDMMEYMAMSKPILFPLYKNVMVYLISHQTEERLFGTGQLPEEIAGFLLSRFRMARPPKQYTKDGWDKMFTGYLNDFIYAVQCPDEAEINGIINTISGKKADRRKQGQFQEQKKILDNYKPKEDCSRGSKLIIKIPDKSKDAGQPEVVFVGDKVFDEPFIEVSSGEEKTAMWHQDANDRCIEPGGGCIPYRPIVCTTELGNCTVDLDSCGAAVVSAFEKAAVSDGRVAIEVVFTEKASIHFLIWVNAIHTYFRSTLKKGSIGRAAAVEILQRRKLEKVCYSPFLVYSAARIRGIHICGLYSIESIATLLGWHNEKGLSDYAEQNHVEKAVPGLDFMASGRIISPVFYYMPRYLYIKRKQNRHLINDGIANSVKDIQNFDEAIGYSYMVAGYLYDEGYCMSMTSPGCYQFRNTYRRKPRKSGRFLVYKIVDRQEKTENPETVRRPELIRDIVCSLADKGIFRQYGVSLLQIMPNGAEFFINKEDVEYVCTAVNVEFLSIFAKNKLGSKDLQTSFFDVEGEAGKEDTKKYNTLISDTDMERIAEADKLFNSLYGKEDV